MLIASEVGASPATLGGVCAGVIEAMVKIPMIVVRWTKVKIYSGIVAYFKEILVEVIPNKVRRLNEILFRRSRVYPYGFPEYLHVFYPVKCISVERDVHE